MQSDLLNQRMKTAGTESAAFNIQHEIRGMNNEDKAMKQR